jgi:hypothetical protein
MFEQRWKYSHLAQLHFGTSTYFANVFLIILRMAAHWSGYLFNM